MDRFIALTTFVAVAETGGFASAARQLQISAPSVTRIINDLEAYLRTRLLIRTTRSVRLSEVGEKYLIDARQILSQLDEAERRIVGAASKPTGHFRMTAPVQLGRLHVMPVMADFLTEYSDITADILLLDRNVSLIDEGLDLGVRIGNLEDSGLTALRVGEIQILACAAPSLLDKLGRPKSYKDLQTLPVVRSFAAATAKIWNFSEGSRKKTVKIMPKVSTNDVDSVIRLAEQGVGVCQLYSYQVADAIRSGRLEVILERYNPPALPVHLIHQEGRMVTTKLRAVLDFFHAGLKERLDEVHKISAPLS